MIWQIIWNTIFYLFSNDDFVKKNCILCLWIEPHMLCGHDVHICSHLMILCTLNGSLRLVQLFVMHSELFNKEDLFLCVRAFNRNPVVRRESPSFQESSDRRVCSHIGTIAFLRPPFNLWIRATLSENFIVMRHQQETFHHAHNSTREHIDVSTLSENAFAMQQSTPNRFSLNSLNYFALSRKDTRRVFQQSPSWAQHECEG